MDNAKFIGHCEQELWQIIMKMHKQGIRYEVIHWLLQETIKDLEIKAVAENWLNQIIQPD